MANALVNEYISQRYDRWLEYAAYHCRLSALQLEPTEVLNDVLCSVLERDQAELALLIESKKNGYTELDYLVLHIIKRNIHSPRSKLRYTKGQHCTRNIEGDEAVCSAETDDFDLIDHYSIIREVLNELVISERSKEIFAWRFFDDKQFSEWQGTESSKYLYDTYNRILLIISAKIQRMKQG